MFFSEYNGVVYIIPSRLSAKVIAKIPEALSTLLLPLKISLMAHASVQKYYDIYDAMDYHVPMLSLEDVSECDSADGAHPSVESLMRKIQNKARPYLEYFKTNPLTPRVQFQSFSTEDNIELCLSLHVDDEEEIKTMAGHFEISHQLPFIFSITLAKRKGPVPEVIQAEINDILSTTHLPILPKSPYVELTPLSVFFFSEENLPIKVIKERSISPIHLKPYGKKTFFSPPPSPVHSEETEFEDDIPCCIM